MLDAECQRCDEVVRDADHSRGVERMEEHIDTKHGGSGSFDVTIRPDPMTEQTCDSCGCPYLPKHGCETGGCPGPTDERRRDD